MQIFGLLEGDGKMLILSDSWLWVVLRLSSFVGHLSVLVVGKGDVL